MDRKFCLTVAAEGAVQLERFRERHGSHKTMICADDDLFDSDQIIPAEEDIMVVGGDCDDDSPLVEYLPEIRQPDVIAEIVADKKLKIE
ncbi:hypothetical protein HYR99_36805 [Candidatus Poribacteria bacterium]|nr:hypothetical protein [Candidatus Poribacteria bacterium]